MDITERILFQDDRLVAFHKPAGWLVHPTPIAPGEGPTCTRQLREHLGAPVHPIHRLDRPTSGVLLFARDPSSARALAEAFSERRVEKIYHAIVRGHPPLERDIDHALREEIDAREDHRTAPNKPAQSARTHLRRLATTELPYPVRPYSTARYALVELTPATGRRHQLRRHCGHISHPIVGDTTHGDGPHNRLWREQFGIHRLLLFASRLTVPHPVTDERMTFHAPIPTEVQAILQSLDLYPPVT